VLSVFLSKNIDRINLRCIQKDIIIRQLIASFGIISIEFVQNSLE